MMQPKQMPARNQYAAPTTIRGKRAEPGRNELCPCCSGLKYKRCHWLLEQMPAGEERQEFAKKITAAQKEWRRWHPSKEQRTSL